MIYIARVTLDAEGLEIRQQVESVQYTPRWCLVQALVSAIVAHDAGVSTVKGGIDSHYLEDEVLKRLVERKEQREKK